jgi:hypothetical protein
MRKIGLVLFLFAAAAAAQTFQPRAALCINPSGVWIPINASTIVGAPTSTYQPINLYGQNTNGNWYGLACDASGNLIVSGGSGTVNAGTIGQIAVYPSNGATVGGVTNPAVPTLPQPAYGAINMWGDSLTSGNQDGSGITVCTVLATLSGLTCNDLGVAGNTSTQVLARMTSSPPAAGTLNVIWTCTNDPTIQPCIGNIQAMVAIVKAQSASFLILPPQNTDNQTSHAPNGVNYLQFVAIGQYEQSLYPANFIGTREALVGKFNPTSLGDTGSYVYDLTPFSYRAQYTGGTLTADITSSTCAIGITTPPSGIGVNGTILIDSEYIWISAYSSPNITACVRGYDGSTAAAHTSGATITAADGVHLGGATGYTYVANQAYQWMQANPSTASNWLAPVDAARALANTATSASGPQIGLFQRRYAVQASTSYFASADSGTSATGSNNDGEGVRALQRLTSGSNNSCSGLGSCQNDLTGSWLTAKGSQALNAANVGPDTAMGYNAGEFMTGIHNSAFGAASCVTLTPANAVTTGVWDTCIGENSGPAGSTQINDFTTLGYAALATKSFQIVLGDTRIVEVASSGVPTAIGTQSVTATVGSIGTKLGGTWAGSFISGTTGTVTVTVTPGDTATSGYTCDAHDLTTPADSFSQTAYTQTTATLSGTLVTNDLVTWKCASF